MKQFQLKMWPIVASLAMAGMLVTPAFAAPSTEAVISKSDGLHIGNTATDRVAFGAATPVARQANTVELGLVLSNLGLRAAGTTPGGAFGALTATTLNGNTFTTGTGTLTLGTGKTTTFDHTSTFTSTDGQTYTFPTTSATLARTDAANTFTGAQTAASGFNQMYHVSIPLSAALINTLYSAPTQLVAAPGAGHFIAVSKVQFAITRTSTAFASGGVVIVQYDSTVHGGGTQACDSTLASTVITGGAGLSDSLRNGAVISDSSALDNKGLYISAQTADFTTGTGTAVVDVSYYIN